MPTKPKEVKLLACYHPVLMYRGRKTSPTGKRPLVMLPQYAQYVLEDDGSVHLDVVQVPCGVCIGCRLEAARQWTVRIMHEGQMHSQNCVLTLTYDDSQLPAGGSLCKRDLQRFMKRLRKKYGSGIKFFACGEYGRAFCRPHYHVVVFGLDFPDRTVWKAHVKPEKCIYRSAALERLWTAGFSSVGVLNSASAAYVARYVTKKVVGDLEKPDYGDRVSEYCVSSRGGRKGKGLAYSWFEAYYGDVYPKDYCTIDGYRHQPPKYYDREYEKLDPERFRLIKKARRERAEENPNNSGRRLLEREHYQRQRSKLLKRKYEEDVC